MKNYFKIKWRMKTPKRYGKKLYKGFELKPFCN
jgi:hypothetical protein